MRYFIVILAAALFAGCSMRDKLAVVGSPEIHMETLSRARVECVVENRSGYNIRVSEGRFRLLTTAGDIATVILTDEVVVPRRAATKLEIPIRMRLNDPLAALGLPDGLLVSGEAKVRMGLARKKIRFEKLPVSEFLDILAR